MSEITHRQWRAEVQPNNPECWRVVEYCQGHGCQVIAAYLDREEALVVAAAPMLLEALEMARAALPDAWFAVQSSVPKEVIERVNEAIAWARKGSSDG